MLWFALFRFVLDDRDSIQDYVSVLHQFTFAATLLRRLTHDLSNQLIPIATCFQNMLNDLAEAIRRWTEKKSNSFTVLVSPLDMMGLIGMTQVVATIAYGIRGLRRGETTWEWSDFDADPEQENLAQMSRWSLNSTTSKPK